MIGDLIDAARIAREEDRDDSDWKKTIVISVTELGFVVAGKAGDVFGTKWAKSLDVSFEEFTGYPALLSNAVRLVSSDLDRAEGRA